MPDRVSGAVLFADISGFTPLTETLANELGAQRGAEEITAHLNRVYHALIDVLHRFGGHVIYFSGDAVTCWLMGDDGLRATACGLAMQATLEGLREVTTPGGTRIRLAMKVAVAVGSARRFLVGDPEVQRIDVLAGGLIDELAAAEQLTRAGETILAQSAHESVGDRVEIRECRTDYANGCTCVVVGRMHADVAEAPLAPIGAPLHEEVVRQWLLPAVYARLKGGHGAFLAELRPAYPLFIRFGGIDYDDDDDATAKLDEFVRYVQRILTSFGGNLLQLTLGDKGGYLYAVFGSPVAHEADAARAASAALELRELPSITAATDIQIGITLGRLRSGTYGHKDRQAFTCLGDAVNLAARLMSKAPPGEIYVSQAVRDAAGGIFKWDQLDPITVKGKTEPVIAFSLRGSIRHASRRQTGYELPLVGRLAELRKMTEKLDDALAGNGQVVGISAEAGMGKSRLAAEFIGLAQPRGVGIAIGECQAYGANTSYFVWREIWATLFRLDDSLADATQVKTLEAELTAIDPALVPRAPLLHGVLDLHIPDNELTAKFDAKLRKASLESLLADCLRARAAATPLVILLEDCYWIDPMSRDLLEVLARAAVGLRVLFVLAYRPADKAGGGLGIDGLPHFTELVLDELDRSEVSALIRSKLKQLLGQDAAAPEALVALVTTRAQGNPFYVEELLSFIRSKGVDLRDEAMLAKIDLPESLHSLILSRIDMLGEAPRQTIKAASVLGRSFHAPMLPGVFPELGGLDSVGKDLKALAAVDLVSVDVEAEQRYIFKHGVTQEVAYQSIPFGMRSILHERVGGYIERNEPGAIDRNLDLLAHHYWRSENLAKKREYLGRAGTAAQAAYANTAAIDYFERLTPLVEQGARVEVLLKLGKVLELVGNWRNAEDIERQALAITESLGDVAMRASCQTALAEASRKQGRFDEALELLARAAQGFEGVGDTAGVGKVQHLVGTVAAQRGDYDKAVLNYEASLRIREQLDDKASMGSLLSNLGVIAEYRGDFDGSRSFYQRALLLRTEIGDRQAIAVSMGNLGTISVLQKRFDEARDWFSRSIALSREIGDAWMVAITHNNLGNAARGLGDYPAARSHYAESLRAYRDYDDRWGLAFLLEDIAMLAARSGDASSALELVGAADAMREAIGTPRAAWLEAELAGTLESATAALPEREREALRATGRARDLAAAVAHALALCEGEPAGAQIEATGRQRADPAA